MIGIARGSDEVVKSRFHKKTEKQQCLCTIINWLVLLGDWYCPLWPFVPMLYNM